jgi:hypothetical protein
VKDGGAYGPLADFAQTQPGRRCWCEQNAVPESQPAECVEHLAATRARRARLAKGAGSADASPAPVRPADASVLADPPPPASEPDEPLSEAPSASTAPSEVAPPDPDPPPDPAPPARVRIKPDPERPRVPSREELCTLALDVYRLALDNVLTYDNKRGETKERSQPDYRGACEALRVVATVAGYSSKGEPPTQRVNESAVDAEAALERMRARIAKNK